jgi:hypothetical protein
MFSHSNDKVIVTGTLLHDIKEIDAGMSAALKISTKMAPRLLGINGLKNIIENNNWKTGSIIEGNPRYMVFSLMKES